MLASIRKCLPLISAASQRAVALAVSPSRDHLFICSLTVWTSSVVKCQAGLFPFLTAVSLSAVIPHIPRTCVLRLICTLHTSSVCLKASLTDFHS